MSDVWFTSDCHLNHTNALKWRTPEACLWRATFESVEEMNETIIDNYNKVVNKNDKVYILGDICLGSAGEAPGMVSRLNGNKELIIGNHDTDAKIKAYAENGIFEDMAYAKRFKLQGQRFYICHYQTLVENRKDDKVWCLHGHTHQKNPFSDVVQNFHVGVETFHRPVHIEEIFSLIHQSHAAE